MRYNFYKEVHLVKIIYRYILKEQIGPFFLGFSVLTFVLLMDRIFELLDLLIGKGLPFLVVLEVFVLSLPFILAVTIPMAVLVATLMSFGRLSQDNEVTALKASGVSFYRLLAPVLLASLLLAVFMAYFNNYILPESNHRVKNLLIDITQKRPTLKIKEGVFINDFEGYNILIKKVDVKRSRIYDVTIYEKSEGKRPRTIMAKKGEILFSPDGKTLQIRLEGGEIHELDEADPDRYLRLTFKKHTIILPVNTELVRQNREYRSDREMSAQAMWMEVRKLKKEITQRELRKKLSSSEIQDLEFKRRQISQYLVEIHKKYAIPFACFVFVLLGAPLGTIVKRGGIGVGFGLSLIFFVLYYIFLVVGEELADRRMVSPFLAMWAANIVLGLIGGWLTLRAASETK